LGAADANIHSETFGSVSKTPAEGNHPAPHPPAGPPGSGPPVTFARSGLTVPWNPKFASLLELAEACDVPVKWSCRSGVCHACETGLIEGDLAYSPEPIDRPGEGIALLCCSTPRSDVQFDA
jgi:ferredoxin